MMETIYYKTLNLKNLLVFVIPTMLMTVIQSLYSMIDGAALASGPGMLNPVPDHCCLIK
ncbi:MAG: hypothetical protein PHY47_13050 [Lachnospiraceae bacterium]|nr:hypothetical protein [Lachnospiraceae bacterium]